MLPLDVVEGQHTGKWNPKAHKDHFQVQMISAID